MLALFPREAISDRPARSQSLALAALVHLPLVTFALLALLLVEPLPERTSPEEEVPVLLTPRLEAERFVPPPPVARDRSQPPRQSASNGVPEASPEQPRMQQQTADQVAATEPRAGQPEGVKTQPPEPGDEAPPAGEAEPEVGDSGAPIREAPASDGELSADQAPRSAGDDPAALPRRRDPAQRGAAGGQGQGLDYRQQLSKGYRGAIRFDNNDFPWDDYQNQIYWLIYRKWLQELLAHAARFGREEFEKQLPNIDSECVIHLVIHRDGRITDIEVVSDGIVITLSAASQKALARVSPLPPLPEGAPREREGVTYSFVIYGNTTAAALEYGLRRELAADSY